MIPILFSETEITFNTNGIGRLYECISVKVCEERNGIYECDFEYPTTGLHYQDIKIGRIIGVTHNLNGDIQPFDIVSYTKPINGVVSFHCVHISYRQNYMTLTCTGIQNLESALLKLSEAQPSNRFNYWTDKSSFGFLGASDGLPHTVRQILGGMQGSILDAYGGEYEWDKWNVNLYSSRGQLRDFSIRYGVNMLNYEEEYSIQETYSSCIPFWTDGMTKVVGNRIESDGVTITQRGECVPLDLSDKFQEEPTQQELELMAFNYMNRNNAFVPVQNIRVEFARIQDFSEYTNYQNLLDCNLCDTINVFFPDLNTSAQFKIVKTVWDVLRDRYESMELGDLSMTLAEALGVSTEQQAKNNILNSIYPIGSVYISTSAVSPADLFGGTWVQIKGRFLLATGTPNDNTNTYWGTDLTYDGANKFNEGAGSTGGESRHTLATYEMPEHNHSRIVYNGNGEWTLADNYGLGGTQTDAYSAIIQYSGNIAYAQNTPASHFRTNEAGSSISHNNMPPYYSVYMWERTA